MLAPRSLLLSAAVVTGCATDLGLHPAVGSSDPPRVYLEPADGRILHLVAGTVGQYDMAKDYARMTGGDLAPIGDSVFMAIPGTRPWNRLRPRIAKRLREYADIGCILNLSVSFNHGRVDGASTAADLDVAEGVHDDIIDELAVMLRNNGVPTLMRIGNEFNGPREGHHPYEFPRAFRRIVERFRALDVDNVAFVWCAVPGGLRDIFARDGGRWKWYPGDDVIDWYGLDVFARYGFDGPGADLSAEMIAAARRAGKPVMIGETTPFQTHIRPLSGEEAARDAVRVWEEWFTPFIAWLDANPEIKAVTMISVDWTKTTQWRPWGDARIQNNPFLAEMWREELRRRRWVHWTEYERSGVPR